MIMYVLATQLFGFVAPWDAQYVLFCSRNLKIEVSGQVDQNACLRHFAMILARIITVPNFGRNIGTHRDKIKLKFKTKEFIKPIRLYFYESRRSFI